MVVNTRVSNILNMVQFCAGCESPILDRFLLNVLDRSWHVKCVQCCECKAKLIDKCFSREGKLFCKSDFFRRYGTKCAGCSQGIMPSDLVRRARDKVFHLNCFTCMVCRKQLSTGEELYVVDENQFICKEDFTNKCHSKRPDLCDSTQPALSASYNELYNSKHYCNNNNNNYSHSDPGIPSPDNSSPENMLESDSNDGSPRSTPVPSHGSGQGSNRSVTPIQDNGQDDLENSKEMRGSDDTIESRVKDSDCGSTPQVTGAKRRGPRTTIKAKQLETLKAAFAATPKPTRHIREQLAQETGLNMRVIQVWFQNRRSKERRLKQLSALGARRNHYFRHARRLRPLRGPFDMDSNPDMLSPPFSYPDSDSHHADFYGHQSFYELFPPGHPHHHPHHHHPPSSEPNEMGSYLPNHPQLPLTSAEQPLLAPSAMNHLENHQYLHSSKDMNTSDSLQSLPSGDLLTLGERYTTLPPRSNGSNVSRIGVNGFHRGLGHPHSPDGTW